MRRESSLDHKALIASAEESIRRGAISEARRLIADIPLKRIPREQIAPIANLARRCGQPRKALELLWPVLHPTRATKLLSTPEEKGEYAVALLAMGSAQEAEGVLEETVPASPELHLYLGFVQMTRWNHAAAAVHFEKFSEVPGLAPYRVLLGQVNLAAALVALGESARAWPLLHEILAVSKANGWSLFHKNALELCAQMAAFEKDWNRAESFLVRIEDDATPNKFDLYVHKWRAVISLYRSAGSQTSLLQLLGVRSEAVRLGHWETIRDCDSHRALVTRDADLLQKVYFGTPYRSYRERLKKNASEWLRLPDKYVWNPNGAKNPNRIFDLTNGSDARGELQLKPGKSLHRTFQILSADFYRPILLGSFHARLFPEEHFNPRTGAVRVHKAVSRLRDWFKAEHLPLDVQTEGGSFRLIARADFGLQVTIDDREPRSNRADFHIVLEQARRLWPERSFSSTELADHFNFSERQARDIVRWGVENGFLSRAGAGRATRYTFTSPTERRN